MTHGVTLQKKMLFYQQLNCLKNEPVRLVTCLRSVLEIRTVDSFHESLSPS